MRFLKRLLTPSGAIFPLHSSDSYSTNPALLHCLSNTNSLFQRLQRTIVTNYRRRYFSPSWNLFIWVKYLIKQRVADNTSEKTTFSLVKATTRIDDSATHCKLAGKLVLCVGGRDAHYSGYKHLIEKSGASMLSFYGGAGDSIGQLYGSLESSDMVICPVDCVNHEAYFTVRHYCQRADKPCVLLQHSCMASFQKGIEKLSVITAKQERPALTA